MNRQKDDMTRARRDKSEIQMNLCPPRLYSDIMFPLQLLLRCRGSRFNHRFVQTDAPRNTAPRRVLPEHTSEQVTSRVRSVALIGLLQTLSSFHLFVIPLFLLLFFPPTSSSVVYLESLQNRSALLCSKPRPLTLIGCVAQW